MNWRVSRKCTEAEQVADSSRHFSMSPNNTAFPSLSLCIRLVNSCPAGGYLFSRVHVTGEGSELRRGKYKTGAPCNPGHVIVFQLAWPMSMCHFVSEWFRIQIASVWRCPASSSAVPGPPHHSDGDRHSGLSVYLSALIYKVQRKSELSLSVTSQAYHDDDVGQVHPRPGEWKIWIPLSLEWNIWIPLSLKKDVPT